MGNNGMAKSVTHDTAQFFPPLTGATYEKVRVYVHKKPVSKWLSSFDVWELCDVCRKGLQRKVSREFYRRYTQDLNLNSQWFDDQVIKSRCFHDRFL